MRKTLCLILAALALLALALPATALSPVGGPFPAMTLPDVDGRQHDLKAMLEGKVGLIIYWSVSCPHCRKFMPQLLELARRYDGNPFVLLHVNGDGQAMAPAAAAYAKEHGLPQPVLLDVGPDDAEPFAESLDLIATPGVAVIDARGDLRLLQELEPDTAAVEKAVQEGF